MKLINISLKNYRTYYPLLVFTENEIIDISFGDERFYVAENKVFFIKKHTTFNLIIKGNSFPKIIRMTENIIKKIIKHIIFVDGSWSEYKNISCGPLLIREMNIIDKNIITYLFKTNTEQMGENYYYEILFLLKGFDKSIYNMIIKSSKTSIIDNIMSLISNDISKKWNLDDLSKSLFLSNISIRKSLELEGVTFTNVILDLRMRHALSLIISSRKKISLIAEEVGYNSASYFIKNFKDYFGVTPKKISLIVSDVDRIVL